MRTEPTFKLWDAIKQYAAEYAKSDRPLPIDEQCEAWLQEFIDRAGTEPMPPDAFQFYATELCSLIADLRK